MNEIFFLNNVSVFSKKKKIQSINLKINKGDFLVIKGSNATGKSLLLKLFYLKCERFTLFLLFKITQYFL